jgi:hypothetical protein
MDAPWTNRSAEQDERALESQLAGLSLADANSCEPASAIHTSLDFFGTTLAQARKMLAIIRKTVHWAEMPQQTCAGIFGALDVPRFVPQRFI